MPGEGIILALSARMGDECSQSYNGRMRLGIIADDLTGSCDVAARLTHLGYCPVVAVGPRIKAKRTPAYSIPTQEAAIVILNTRSRDCSLRETVARSRAAAQVLKQNGIPLIYQKIDSTLRGHWAEALQAFAEVTKPEGVMVCPAFPALGRYVRHGKVHFAQKTGLHLLDPADREKRLHPRTTLEDRCHWQAREIELRFVRRGTPAIRLALSSDKAGRCVVFDAERERDLQTIGRTFRNSLGRLLWVGSAGLIRYVIPRLCPPEVVINRRSRDAPWILLQGSREPTSRKQFRRLENKRGFYFVNFSPGKGQKTMRLWCQGAAQALGAGKNVAIVAPEQFDRRVRIEFPHMVVMLLQVLPGKAELGGIFVTGGNTAEALCDSLRTRTLRVVEEIRPGIAASLALDGRWPGLQLVTKAGSFGGPGQVWHILRRYCRAS